MTTFVSLVDGSPGALPLGATPGHQYLSLLVLAVLVLFWWGLRKSCWWKLPGTGRSLRVLERVLVAPHQGLSIIEIAGSRYLIAHCAGGISILKELSSERQLAAGEAA